MLRQPRVNERLGWNADALRALVTDVYGDDSIVILANREPVRHDRAPDGRIVSARSSGGLVSALEPLIEACSGVWIGQGAGTADHEVVDAHDGLDVPSAKPSYRLRRVWLDSREQHGYYDGFANEGLWPLCHRAHVQPIFRADDFRIYSAVNARFTSAVSEEVCSQSPLILVQDYHFALAPHLIRMRLPQATIATFWHIPFPNPHDFSICPWRRQLLEGLLGSTLVGFQTPDDCRNFVDAAERVLHARINTARDVITYQSRQTRVRAYPVSVEWPNRWASQSMPVEACRVAVRDRLGLPRDIGLGIGIDRLDYTKGIVEKFMAIERLLELHPELRSRFSFVQIAEPSRACLPAYRDLRVRVVAAAERVNARFGTADWRPIALFDAHHEPLEVFELLRAADLCYVGSLHDGMNLVAKEFVAARNDLRGVLILSEFAGAARELLSALMVNPYDVDGCAEALAVALSMPPELQASRMRTMRSTVARFNIYRWAGEMLTDAAALRGAVLASGWSRFAAEAVSFGTPTESAVSSRA